MKSQDKEVSLQHSFTNSVVKSFFTTWLPVFCFMCSENSEIICLSSPLSPTFLYWRRKQAKKKWNAGDQSSVCKVSFLPKADRYNS